MNYKNELKNQAEKIGIEFGPGRIDSLSLDDSGCAYYGEAEDSIQALDDGALGEAKSRLGLDSNSETLLVQEQLNEQLVMFKFSFHAFVQSYGDKDPDVPLTWISNGTSFEDDFHRSAWILAGCGILQTAGFVCKGFDVPNSDS